MKLKKRIDALLMAGAMVCSTLPVNVLAVESSDQNAGGLCEHHTEHNADCGYVCEICSTEEEPTTAFAAETDTFTVTYKTNTDVEMGTLTYKMGEENG